MSDLTHLYDLEKRVGQKAWMLVEMAKQANGRADDAEYARLRAKAEGVHLALSFIKEAITDALFDVDDTRSNLSQVTCSRSEQSDEKRS